MRKIFNKEQIEFIKNNYKVMTYKQMSLLELFNGLNEKQIRNKALSLNCKKERSFNKDYFEKIDSEEKAYWLGFIYADGYIVFNEKTRNYELGIEIHKKDGYLLEMLNKSLGNSHKIKNRKRDVSFNGYKYEQNTSSIRIYSKKIVSDLIKNGVEANKTNSLSYPILKCDKILFLHFLRGFFDGDGSIYKNVKGNLEVSFTNSNKVFLTYILNTIKKLLNIEGRIYKEKDKKYILKYFRKNDVLLLLSYIYKESNIKLKRKFDIYINNTYGSPN